MTSLLSVWSMPRSFYGVPVLKGVDLDVHKSSITGLIASMGLGAIINIPVIYDDEIVSTMNILDAEHAYSETYAAKGADLANLLIPAHLAARFKARAA